MESRPTNSGWSIQLIRKIVQYGFLTMVILIGIQFTLFVGQLASGRPTLTRPPGIEAFLPISSLISLKYWVVSGNYNRIHPSGILILSAALATALVFKRGFCSWVCPFGLLTEYLNRLHGWIFRRKLILPRWLDYPLRSLKYLLLLFFLWAILIQMDERSLLYFIHSPYNMVADIKMLHFFTDISPLAFWVLAALVVLSILIRNFWCRYLCPYGALLGVASLLSVFKVHRNESSCTQCRQCTRTCPVDIKVHKHVAVMSDECHGCLKCVAVCPEPQTLYCSVGRRTGILRPWVYAAAICLLFIIPALLGRTAGIWHNEISIREYQFHVQHLDQPLYQHNRGRVPAYNLEAWLRMMRALRMSEKSFHPVRPARPQ